MNEADALLAAIVSDPCEDTGWLALADWLDENDDEPRRGELLRLHRKLLATCCEPDEHPERQTWHARVVELLVAGVQPCVPRKTLTFPGGVAMTLAFIPPGSFLMGSNHHDHDEKPVHKVTLTKGFFLGVHAVTQEQWQAVMGSNPSYFRGARKPVDSVSWNNCQEFCKKATEVLNGRPLELPTEAEWEWACRAGTTTEYHFGDVLNVKLANYNGQRSRNGSPKGKYRKQTTEVDLFPSNLWGLHDMHGNAWEWCFDLYGKYTAEDQTNPQGRSNMQWRVLRGGCFDYDPLGCRAAMRVRDKPHHRYQEYGFRVCFRLD